MPLTKVPNRSQLSDGLFVQVEGPDGLLSGFQYDRQQRALYAKESQIVFPSHHGITHINEDPIPAATCDTPGLMEADDKCKLDAMLQTRVGVLGFMGAGFPDDGGYMSGDIILASGSDFISLERVGNVIRFTVDVGSPLACACESCAQIWWQADETSPTAIRPPTCSGRLPDVNAYGELKIYLMPPSVVVDPTNPSVTLNRKSNYPALLFKRYPNATSTGQASYEVVLKRNATNSAQTEVGLALTPGPTRSDGSVGIPECVWFAGLDDDGNLLRFDMIPETTPGLLGGLFYSGNRLTKQAAVITNYTSLTLTNNQYECRLWNVIDAEPIGDTITATNVWRYQNPEDATSGTSGRSLVLDSTIDILPIGMLVDIWQFQVSETNGVPTYRNFFIQAPTPSALTTWSLVGSVQFGDIVQEFGETEVGTAATRAAVPTSGLDDFEQTMWGLSGSDVPLLTYADVEVGGTGDAVLNTQHRADIDTTLPGLVVNADSGSSTFSQRPVMLWCRSGMASGTMWRAEVGRSTLDGFSPYDVLLQAPIDSHNDVYMRVTGTGVVNGVAYVLVKGASFHDLPRSGTVRIISSTNKNRIFTYGQKLMFPASDNDAIALMASASDNVAYPGSTGDIIELLRHEYSAPCVRVEFTNNSGAVSVQFKVGILGMDTPYEDDNSDSAIDDFVRGLRGGYAVSAVYTQDSTWTGIGTVPDTNADNFYVYDGGEASDVVEYWNVLEVMYRDGQVWIWWNGLLIPPSTSLSAALSSPVTITTPYFQVSGAPTYGKYGMRLWPGARVRRAEVRSQPRQFSEFSYGGLTLS